eukprot:TRINITY_DN7630_c0_g1_i1.p1 TRINITY_DN7630_c0_g1~~TRINITY_DN7630_c0_g1_i1.p1  ORF type:complete len:133 (+),score=23.02 TRINITY_DN7630_c0_g1_i1:173-571(+)
MTLRLWTSGWDFYAPGINIVYHLWERTHRPNFRENPDKNKLEERSKMRVYYILGMINIEDIPLDYRDDVLKEIDTHGINSNSSRTIEDYEKYSGVHFRSKSVDERAKLGGQPKEMFVDFIFDMIFSMMKNNS